MIAHRLPPAAYRRSGFTLIEVMVALGILVLGIGGILAMFMAAATTHRRALDETIAAMIAESELSQYRVDFNRGRLADLSAVTRQPAGFPFHTCTLKPTVMEVEAQTGRTTQLYVEAVVTWQRQGKPRTATYRTIIFRE